MAESVEELLNVLYNMVQDSFTMPFGGAKCVLDREKVLELLDEINATMPGELEQARKIVATKNDILANAQRDADAVKRQAEERARQMLSKEEILIAAKQKANEMMTNAETKSREIRAVTNQYVDDALKRTEEALTEALKEVHDSRSRFKAVSK